MYASSKEASKQFLACTIALKFADLSEDILIALDKRDIVLQEFRYESKVTDVYIPYGVTVLGNASFSGTNVQQVHLCKSISEIGYGCFANCPDLKRIVMYRSQEKFLNAVKYGNSAEVVFRD